MDNHLSSGYWSLIARKRAMQLLLHAPSGRIVFVKREARRSTKPDCVLAMNGLDELMLQLMPIVDEVSEREQVLHLISSFKK